MDVVSDAISAVHLGHPRFDRVAMDGSWSARLDPYDGAGFHIVLKGSCWLRTDGGTAVCLNVGDAVLLPHGTGHVIADSPATWRRRCRSSGASPRRSRAGTARRSCSAANTGSTAAACTR
ncbi:hypothetical protein GCM10020001_103240 [Nonomuraea salmonea]